MISRLLTGIARGWQRGIAHALLWLIWATVMLGLLLVPVEAEGFRYDDVHVATLACVLLMVAPIAGWLRGRATATSTTPD
jgi:hypothetical protein